MRLRTARIQNYRSIKDTGIWEVDATKTILVGPNEAGKTAVLRALQQLNPPKGVKGFDSLRDYPRALYNDISRKIVDPKNVPVVTGVFSLDPSDQLSLPPEYQSCTDYTVTKYLANNYVHDLTGGPTVPRYGSLRKDLLRIASHVDDRTPAPAPDAKPKKTALERLTALSQSWVEATAIEGAVATSLLEWLTSLEAHVDEDNEKEQKRLDDLIASSKIDATRTAALKRLWDIRPILVLYSNYFRVMPLIHLRHLADRVESNVLDDDQYDYGNLCLLRLLGFSPRELSNLGAAPDPGASDANAMISYRDQLDRRSYELNSASVRLTREIRQVWNSDPNRADADKLLIRADGQYLKVVVEDDVGVEVELDQRSEGFQWIVSFFVVFFAESEGANKNAILLLDEPGVSLHALKQRDFRLTVSRLAEKNQTIYSTHSPFLVGPEELDRVRVVEMTDRSVGTKVHTSITSTDPAALLPLQEALGYDLAQSLFAQQRNLILEGLTDYWYIEALSDLLREAGLTSLNDKIALVPAGSAGKVVYFATILHAQKLKVATLLDSDGAGDQAARQDVLVHTLGNKRILRTKDYLEAAVAAPEIEDLLRETLVQIAKDSLGLDVSVAAAAQPLRPIVDLLGQASADFSKYKLAKAFVRWSRDHSAANLSELERRQWQKLVTAINGALK